MFTERKNVSMAPCRRRTRMASNRLLGRGRLFAKAALGLGMLLAGSSVNAQSNDHIFRSWRWVEDVPAPRAAGLGGAFVAVADDSSATFLNPAGLTLLPKTEVSARSLESRVGSIRRG